MLDIVVFKGKKSAVVIRDFFYEIFHFIARLDATIDFALVLVENYPVVDRRYPITPTNAFKVTVVKMRDILKLAAEPVDYSMLTGPFER